MFHRLINVTNIWFTINHHRLLGPSVSAAQTDSIEGNVANTKHRTAERLSTSNGKPGKATSWQARSASRTSLGELETT